MSTHSDIQNQYLNIRVANDTIKPFKPAEYTRNNTTVLLEQPRLYKLSVDRFKIPTNTIPLLIAQNKPESPPDQLVYEFTMIDSLGNTHTDFVEYVPNDPNLSTNDPRYYYIYSYSRFISMLNTTLANIFEILYPVNMIPVGQPIYNSVPPHFEFDPVAQKLSLVVPSIFFDPNLTDPDPVWKLRFNFELLRFFQGFEANIIVQGEVYEFITANRYNNNVEILLPVVQPPPEDPPLEPITVNYLNMLPDYNALSRWNELDSVQIITNIPVNQQFVETADTQSSTSSKPILTDFIVLYPDPNSYAATTLDLSTTERSWYDLYGTSPIRNVQLTFLWVSYTGQVYPLYISRGDAITLKLLFKVRPDI
jgi:hypothetical protein